MIINKFRREGTIYKLIKKYFNISDIEREIKCEGIKILVLLSKLDKINDKNLKKFVDNGHLNKLVNQYDKKKYIIKFLEENKTLKKNLSFNNIFLRESNIKLLKKDILSRGLKMSKISIKKEQTINKYKKKTWVAVGIDNYAEWPKLINPVSDINKIDTFFSEKNFNIIKISNENATKSKIEQIFKEYLFQNLDSDDLLVFSFHGHGTFLKINTKEYGFIVPSNAPKDATPYDLISIEDITNWTKYLKSNHILVVMDCCFSGFAVLRGNIEEKFSEIVINKVLSQKNKIVITAGNSNQLVSDGGWGNNSIFTGLLLSFFGLKKGLGSVFELYSYLLKNVPKYSNQTPCIGKLIGDEGGDIFLNL